METNLVVEGLKFMILGMGTVLAFLVIMILFMMLQAKIIRRCFPEPNQEGGAACSVPSTPAVKDNKKNKVAAIMAAIFEDKKNS